MRLVELNGRELGFDELSQALKRVPTGVEAIMTFAEVRQHRASCAADSGANALSLTAYSDRTLLRCPAGSGS